MLSNKSLLIGVLGICFVLASGIPNEADAQQPTNQQNVEKLSPEALDALVAGVAFYPEEVVEQALAAAFYPAAIREAAALSTQQFHAAKSKFSPSIVYLREQQQELLGQLSTHLELTARLGLAAQVQLDEVWTAVDRVRQRYATSLEAPDEEVSSSGEGTSGGHGYPVYGAFVAGLVVDDGLHELYYTSTGTTYVGPNGTTVTTDGDVIVYDSPYSTAAAGQVNTTVNGPQGNSAEINAQGAGGATTYGDTTYFGSTGSGDVTTSTGFYGQGTHAGEGSLTTNSDGSVSFNRDGQTSLNSTYGSTDIQHQGSGTATGYGNGTYNGSTDIQSSHGDVSTTTHASGGQATTTVSTDNGQQTFVAGDGQIGSQSAADSAARSATARPSQPNSSVSDWLNGLSQSQRKTTQNAMANAWGQLDSKARMTKRDGPSSAKQGNQLSGNNKPTTLRHNSTARPANTANASKKRSGSSRNTLNSNGFNRTQSYNRGGGRSYGGGRGGRGRR